MKTLTILFTLFYFLNAIAAAPYGIKGQQQIPTLYSNVHQFPNNQVTNLGGINALVETGNKNILSNPSFEHLTALTGWTNSAGGAIANIGSLVIDGKQSVTVALSSQAMDFYQDSTLYNAEFNGSVQGIATVRVNTTVAGVRVCSRANGVVTASNCVNVINDGKWGLYKVPFILAFGSNGISINTNGTSVSGNINIDDAFVGASDITQNMSACNNVSCETEFSAKISSAGVVSGENLDWINGNCTVASTSQYTCTFNSSIFTVAPNCTLEDNDNGNFTQSFISSPTSTGFTSRTLNGATGSNTAASHTIICQKQGADYATAKQLSNGNTYSSTNSDTDWASCGHTTSDFTGFGTVTAIETQCKRDGGDLLMKGKFTSGTSTAVEARLNLKLNSVTLTSKSSVTIPSLQFSGSSAYSAVGAVSPNTLIEPSVTYITFGGQSSSLAGLSKRTGDNVAASGTSVSILARIPIEGWQQSNIIIGQFNGLESCSSTLDCTDTFSAKVSAAGAVSDENTNFISGNCALTDTSLFTCTWNTSIFSVTPNCVASMAADISGVSQSASTGTVNTTSGAFRVLSGGAKSAQAFNIVCQKQGADYVGKTALAVASDQNVRTPGVAKSVVYSAYIGGAGTVFSEIGNLMNGNCTVASTNVFTCTFTSGIFASDPVCNLTVMGASGASRSAYIVTSPTTSGLTYLTYNTSGPTAVALNVQLTCHGVSP